MNYKQMLNKAKQLQPIDNALVSTLYTLSIKSQLTGIVSAILITIFLYSELAYSIVIWGTVLAALFGFRIYQAYLFKTTPHIYSIEIWYKKFMIFASLTALMLSSLSFVFMSYLNEYHQLFLLVFLLGTAGIAITSLSSDFRIALVYISLIMIPLFVSLLLIKTSLALMLAIMMLLFFISQIGMIFNNYTEQKKVKELKEQKDLLHETLQAQVEKNQFLLEENKLFISDMVHQIRTPLSVIMINSSLIEIETKNQVSSYVAQINSAINMLSNSYEDLNYITSSDTMEYKTIEINLTEFLNERIDFFEVIAQANDKIIYTNIADDVKVTMNDTELERLIDNNLSNAIKHSYNKSEIEIVLEKNHSEIILKFISKGKDIRDIAKIFDKNYTESYQAKRNLGLGLNMVKSICEKNHINYSVHSEDETNIFTYVFNG